MNTMKSGEKNGRLTFLSSAGISQKAEKRAIGIFLCDCGTKKELPIGRVRCGYVKSCGCIQKQAEYNKKHGMRNTKEYSTWQSVRKRVLNKNDKNYDFYSKLDNDIDFISSFISFYNEIGACPGDDCSIDRIDNTKGYKRGNIRWATREDQGRNKKNSCVFEIKGMYFETLKQASEYFGRSIQTVFRWCYGSYDSRRDKWTIPKPWARAILRYTTLSNEQKNG